MIEREFVEQRKKEYQSQEFISSTLKNVGHSHTKLQKTPLGEKIIIYTARPGLIVGKKGQNISKLTETLKKEFKFDNPQIEISEVENINLDAQIVAERIASSLERFGSQRFKGAMHRAMEDVMKAGALGVEILLSGKIPSSRARRWRVFDGYLKKCGNLSEIAVQRSKVSAHLRSGTIGVQVSIMTKDPRLLASMPTMNKDEVEEAEKQVEKEEKTEEKPKAKKTAKAPKAAEKAEEKTEEKPEEPNVENDEGTKQSE